MFPEFTREVTDTQMPLVAPVILPEMYKIFTMAEVLLQLFKLLVPSGVHTMPRNGEAFLKVEPFVSSDFQDIATSHKQAVLRCSM